ncbi:MAG TPA: hypothetical protein VMV10_11270 [Pirellulales bacterium]|nr:hypothetical protein [Pirellulales bacterium]
MQRFGVQRIASAIVMIALAAAAEQASAADLAQAGFGYGGWGGMTNFGYAGPANFSGGYMGGYMGGYPGGYMGGGGGWGYGGSCCNNIWAGYCNEMQGCRGGCRGCRVKHRSRALGCGAGPCCQPTCAQGACGAVDCCQPACEPAPVCCPAPRPRRHMCCLRRRRCRAACGVADCAVDGCCGYDADAASMSEGADAPAPASTPADGLMPEAIEPPAPTPGLDSST